MSLAIRALVGAKKLSRPAMLALIPPKEYNDGRTKQCHKDECNIQKIMDRFNKTGTISHLAKYEGTYADFSDFDFHTYTTKIAQGEQIFDALPAEVRKEFGQSPQAFFEYVNDPENRKVKDRNLPALAAPGQQLPRTPSPDANLEAADAAASEPASATSLPTHSEPLAIPKTPAGGAT